VGSDHQEVLESGEPGGEQGVVGHRRLPRISALCCVAGGPQVVACYAVEEAGQLPRELPHVRYAMPHGYAMRHAMPHARYAMPHAS
jgi:hypothetical protein